jgi:dihydrofolate reductase
MTIHMIWAQSQDSFIGKDGGIPWHVPEDLAMFKAMTEDKIIVMGRKTWESLDGALPNRSHIILTRQRDFKHPGGLVAVCDSPEMIMNLYRNFWVIGGKDIYQTFLPYADHIVKTYINVHIGDGVRAPGMFPPNWRQVVDYGWKTSRTGIDYNTVEYIRND